MTAETIAACRCCREQHPLRNLLLVTEVRSGARFYVCRPSVRGPCFSSLRGAGFHTIAPAGLSTPLPVGDSV